MKEFLSGYYTSSIDDGRKEYKYSKQLTAIANREQTALVIDLNDLEEFADADDEMVKHIERNAKRYFSYLITLRHRRFK